MFFLFFSQSGKSTFLLNLVKFRQAIFNTSFHQIYYCLPPESHPSKRLYIEELQKYCPELDVVHGLPKYQHIFQNPLPKLFLVLNTI